MTKIGKRETGVAAVTKSGHVDFQSFGMFHRTNLEGFGKNKLEKF